MIVKVLYSEPGDCNAKDIYISDKKLHINKYRLSIPIRYCPCCGKKLE